MIYFDNAATSRPKPNVVYDAYNYYLREIGTSPGRGSYGLAITASRMLYQSRKTVARFFGIDDPANVVFTKNSTEAINLFFDGFLKKGDHVLISPYEHNAVLRPLHTLKEQGVIEYSILPESVIYTQPEKLSDFIRPNTRMIALTLASNLTGQIVFSKKLAAIAKSQANLTVFVDSSQGAGKKIIEMKRDGIDVLAFTGHKDLFAVPGVGGLVSQRPLEIVPLIQGGTGIHGDSYVNPAAFPDSYEAGTLNMPAIWTLKTSLEYIETYGSDLNNKENMLISRLLDYMKHKDKILVYNLEYKRVPTFCFNIKDMPSNSIVQVLDKSEVCVRGGIHCAILAHETIGTVKTGAVRVSLNAFNTEHEIEKFIRVIEAI